MVIVKVGSRRTLSTSAEMVNKLRVALWVALVPMLARAEDLPAARACGALVSPTQRLACYDAAFEVAPRPPEALFGDNERLQKPHAVAVVIPKQVNAVVTRAAPLGQGLYQLTLDNGQVWTTHQGDWSLVFDVNDAVTIVHMPLGGYQISKPGVAHSVTARRIQ